VQIQDREMKVEFLFEGEELTLLFKKIKGKLPLTAAEAKEVAIFLRTYSEAIIEKWNKVFIYQKRVEAEFIRKRIRKRKK
jgi:hypothetical protein